MAVRWFRPLAQVQSAGLSACDSKVFPGRCAVTGWNAELGAASAGAGAVTLLAGTSFCISASNGDIVPLLPHGLFFRDTRFVAEWVLLLNGRPLESLGLTRGGAYQANFVCRAAGGSGSAERHLLIERRRLLDGGMGETLIVRNYSAVSTKCTIQLTVGADFADLFEVKGGKPQHEERHVVYQNGRALRIESQRPGHRRRTEVEAPGAELAGHAIVYQVEIEPQGTWSTHIWIGPTVDGVKPESDLPEFDRVLASMLPESRQIAWTRQVPVVKTSNKGIAAILRRSRDDLGSLRIFDPSHPDRTVVAAGSPWFMALFGRDSLLTSFMALPLDPSLALGTLNTLASLQGKLSNALQEEEPGKILHEVRFGSKSTLELDDGNVYYGSVDATPLFVILASELVRWGVPRDSIAPILPAVDSALSWIELYGDMDRDGFVEYRRSTVHGLANQGWKDSWDAINFADGTMAEAPLALCEVQGYVYAAYQGRALLARESGDMALAATWTEKAAALKAEFNKKFWIARRGYFALALDSDKNPVDACASNMGHCLWTGIVDDDKAKLVVDRLMSEEMFSGWGVRTLATDMVAYNPASYHNGSVWPHENALIADGLMHYGFCEEAQRIATGILDAADSLDGRLPELLCGFDRGNYPTPIPYPTSCSPQAWASSAPIHLMRVLMGFDPCLPLGGLWLNPQLPSGFGDVKIMNIPLAGSRIAIEVADGCSSVSGLPRTIQLHRGARKPGLGCADTKEE